jgi:hypothetical protein
MLPSGTTFLETINKFRSSILTVIHFLLVAFMLILNLSNILSSLICFLFPLLSYYLQKGFL